MNLLAPLCVRITAPILVVLLLAIGAPLHATTIIVDAVNGNDVNDGQSAPVKTLKAAWALMPTGGGHTMLIKPGTYSDPNDAVITSDIVNGTPGNYNIIKAEVDGTAIIMQPMDLLPITAAPAGFPSTSDNLATTPQYLQFEGLKWFNEIDNTPGAGGGDGANVSIVGHHIKILRSSFRGAGNCQNFSTLAIGRGVTEAQNWKPTHHILVEDSWAYGLGGRYNVSIFHAEDIVIRRVVLRHDGGWNGNSQVAGCKNDPEAAIATYNSSNVHLQNVMVIDSNIFYSANGNIDLDEGAGVNNVANRHGNWEGTIYTLYNSESGVQNVSNPQNDVLNANVLGVVHDNTGSTITGSIILFSHGNGYKYEVGNASQVTNADGAFPAKSVTGAVLQDSVVLNAAVHGLTVATGGGGAELIELDINNTLIATTETDLGTRMNFGVRDNDGAGSNDIDLNNVLIIGHEFNALNDSGGLLPFDEVNVDCFDATGNNCLNALGATPIGTDLKFPIRLEAGAAITSGPTIVKRIGDSGTLFGDANFNAVTATDLWPWPYESRIKRDFSEPLGILGTVGYVSSPTGATQVNNGVPGQDLALRGWTATDLTLTEYIWNALGADVATDPASAGVLIGVPGAVAVP